MTMSAIPGSRRLDAPDRPSGFQIHATAAEKYERTAGAFMSAWADDLVGRARLRRGERILDLACGTGFVARVAARTVGDDGSVVGVDLNPAMVTAARSLTDLEIVEAAAERTGLAEATFDVVLCQQGLQYVSDPDAVLREVARLLRPGGRFVMSVWADFDRNPFRAAQLASMARHLTTAAVDAYRRTTIAALDGPTGLARRLDAAGMAEVAVVEHTLTVTLPPLASFLPELIGATPWASAFGALSPGEQAGVVGHIRRAVGDDSGDDRATVPMTVVVATASRPRRAAGSISG